MYKLEYYKTTFKDCLIPGSKDWYLSRKQKFGGSEIATVLNKNKNKKFSDLVQEKKNISEIEIDLLNKYNDSMLWGKLFEPIAKHFIEAKYNRNIHEFGSIPVPFVPVSYTPDGIILNEDKSDILLLEIKCPMQRRIINAKGEIVIPEYYIPQIQTGLNIFHAEYCLFVQCRFRRCKLKVDSKNMEFDRNYHKEFIKKSQYKAPMAFGYLYWMNEKVDRLIDLGESENIIETLSPYFKMIQEVCTNVSIIDQEIEVEKLKPGFILKWKLFDLVPSMIKPEKNYLQKHESTLWNKYKEMYEFLYPNNF